MDFLKYFSLSFSNNTLFRYYYTELCEMQQAFKSEKKETSKFFRYSEKMHQKSYWITFNRNFISIAKCYNIYQFTLCVFARAFRRNTKNNNLSYLDSFHSISISSTLIKCDPCGFNECHCVCVYVFFFLAFNQQQIETFLNFSFLSSPFILLASFEYLSFHLFN